MGFAPVRQVLEPLRQNAMVRLDRHRHTSRMQTRILTLTFKIAVACAVLIGLTTMRVPSLAAQSPKPDQMAMVAPGSLTWTPAGPGISAAVLSGSPNVDGAPFVLRLKLAAGTRVPPHWHPVDEHLTVVSGTFYMGSGERFDESGGMALVTGSYAMMPKEVRHFGWAGAETVVQIHGVGPFKTYFVEQPAK